MFLTLTLNPAIDCTLSIEGALRIGAVHKAASETRTPGGKGINVAKALAAAGKRVCAAGLLGTEDIPAYDSLLRANGVDTFFLAVPHPTRRNVMAVDECHQEIKFNRPGFPELDFEWDKLTAYARELGALGQVVIMSGSLPARFPPDTYARLTALFHGMGKAVVVDCSGAAFALAAGQGPEAIKPNRAEMEEWIGHALPNQAAIVSELNRRSAQHAAVVLSDGARGAWFAADGAVYHGTPPPATVVDTTGAGDWLLGQFCADFFPNGRLSQDLVARAVAAGTAATEVRGTPFIPFERVRALANAVSVARVA